MERGDGIESAPSGWWAVGAHVFIVVAIAAAVTWLAGVVLAMPLVKSYVPATSGS
jgi:hypothetical protein